MITRREVLKTFAAAPAILRSARRAGDRPNLLFLWTDQQRADTLAAYGNNRYRVPVMNRLASEAVVFERAYVTQPVCTPSRSSIMTGTWPHHNGFVHNNIALSRNFRTLPELLSGYHTAYMGKWHLGDEIFRQRGYEEWESIEDGIYQSYYSEGRDKNARSSYHQFLVSLGYKPDDEKHKSFSRNFATTLPVEHSKPSFLAQNASRFILKNRAEPWALYVNTLEPHTPFASALNDLHSEAECPLLPNCPGVPETPEPESYRKRRERERRSPEQWLRMQRNYAGLCSLVDQAWGRILWALETSGQAENTIIVHSSDHGEMMGAHSLQAKSNMYEEAVHVPFLLRVPFRNQRPMRVAQPVSHIDTAATLFDLLGGKGGPFDGRSLVPALDGRRPPEPVFLEWNVDETGGPSGRTVVTPDGYKMVVHDTDKCLLFDRNRDPLEMNNLYYQPAHQATVKRLRKVIAEWQVKTKDKLELPS